LIKKPGQQVEKLVKIMQKMQLTHNTKFDQTVNQD